ncbi:U1 small nuclear ribonucleoprotein C-like isoform X1 [Panthera tigris]|uniref:U1 small nuclear ribonucleoprotein C-like isoform X1 n=1 Tax=Panthera tigris TaxID=9694 RepID=UPI001C6FBE27|nr:U1 small nuclear ribonucleoprotein C-like isoform X1 [Panthera tigris]
MKELCASKGYCEDFMGSHRYLRGRSRARRAGRHAIHRDCPLRSEFSSVPTAPGHAPAPPGPGVVFLGLPGPGLAGACLPPQPGRLLAEPAASPPAGRRLALASAEPAAAAGGHRPGRRTLGALAQLLQRAPAPHMEAPMAEY